MASFTIVQNDTAPPITATLTAGGTAVDLSGASVVFELTSRAGDVIVESAAVVDDATAGEVSYQWVTGDTAVMVDHYRARWKVTFADATIRHFPSPGYTTVHVVGDFI